jgi:hypothetical protein
MEPYGLYLGEVASAMAEMVAGDPVALAEVSATDLVLADPASRAPWLLKAVAEGRLKLAGRAAAGALVFHVERALPRSFLAFAAQSAAESEIPHALISRRDTVLLNKDRILLEGGLSSWPAGLLSVLPTESSTAPTVVIPTAWQPGTASYQVSAPAPALLVESDAFMPGWHAFVDGKEQPIVQANAFGRGVLLPPGDHRIDWQFRPRWVVASLAVSWTALAGCLLAAALSFVRRRARAL